MKKIVFERDAQGRRLVGKAAGKVSDLCIIVRLMEHSMTLTIGDWCQQHSSWVAMCTECELEFHTMRPNGARTCGVACRKRRSRRNASGLQKESVT